MRFNAIGVIGDEGLLLANAKALYAASDYVVDVQVGTGVALHAIRGGIVFT